MPGAERIMNRKSQLCDWERCDIEKDIATLVSLIHNPKYVCKKCARVSNTESVLCKSLRIKKKLFIKVYKSA